MASRKTAKKATKKTAPKKVVKKTAAKRTYVRKPKVEIADDLTVAVTEAAAEPQREESNSDYRDVIIERQVDIIEDLSEQITNPKNVALKLATLGPVVYLDTAHLDMQNYAVEKAIILHILGRDGYMIDAGQIAMSNVGSIVGIQRLLSVGIMKLNTVNRVVSVEVESELPEGTVLTRITPNLCTPKPSVEPVARIVSHTVEVDGVSYRRSY